MILEGLPAAVTATIGLGCASLGNLYQAMTDDDASATVDAAWDAGVRVFDTAPLYGCGLSERRLGQALRSRPRREYRISTKVGRLLVDGSDPGSLFVDTPDLHPVFDFTRDGVLRSVEASLGRLGLDRVDTLLVHDPDNFADEALAGAFPALRRLRDEGVVGAIGAGMNQTRLLCRFVREADLDCVLVAGRWTLFDRGAGDELLPLCEEAGVEAVVGGVFNSGLLADPAGHPRYDYAPASPSLIEAARRMAAVCDRFGVSLRGAATQFAARHPAVTTVLTGAASPAEITENVADFSVPVPEALWAELDRIAGAHGGLPAG